MYNCQQLDGDESDTSSDGDAMDMGDAIEICDAMDAMDVASNGTSASSYEPSMRSASASVVSISSTVQLFKEEHGRLINTWGNIYALPGDAEEFARLSKSDATISHDFH